MKLYDYLCEACDTVTEHLVRGMGDAVTCACGATKVRLMPSPMVSTPLSPILNHPNGISLSERLRRKPTPDICDPIPEPYR